MFIVCIDVRIRKQNALYRSIKWELGGCVPTADFRSTKIGPTYFNSFVTSIPTFRRNINYHKKNSLIERCCLEELENDLSCEVLDVFARHEGWGDGHIEIQGNPYCNDFIGYRSMRKVLIKSNIKFQLLQLLENMFK